MPMGASGIEAMEYPARLGGQAYALSHGWEGLGRSAEESLPQGVEQAGPDSDAVIVLSAAGDVGALGLDSGCRRGRKRSQLGGCLEPTLARSNYFQTATTATLETLSLVFPLLYP
jgi:hypothetical protein